MFLNFLKDKFGKKKNQSKEVLNIIGDKEPKLIPHNKGKKLFKYSDGFRCYAFNQEEADKKYNNHLTK